MPSQEGSGERKIVEATHLHTNEKGEFVDTYIEQTFSDIFEGVPDEITIGNLGIYTKHLFGGRMPIPPSEIFIDTEKALAWATHFGFVQVWRIEPADVGNFPQHVWGAKIGNISIGQVVRARSLPHVLALAVVQMLREIYFQLNNRDNPKKNGNFTH